MQACLFSPVCTTLCRVSCSLRLNALPHTVQAYGLSELWLCLCLVKWSLRFNPAPQISHTNRRSVACVPRCSSSRCLSKYSARHSGHPNIVVPSAQLVIRIWPGFGLTRDDDDVEVVVDVGGHRSLADAAAAVAAALTCLPRFFLFFGSFVSSRESLQTASPEYLRKWCRVSVAGK